MASHPKPRPLFAPETIRRVGLRESWRGDLYHRMVTLRWRSFVALGTVLYLLQPGSIAGARPGSVADAFFFSVETIATIGYGVMSPGPLYGNILMVVETVVGILLVALATGVIFARASRPTARVRFAQAAVIAPWNGVPTLFLRMGNERRSQILEADVSVHLLRHEVSSEGISMRRFHTLRLERGHTPVFALSYTAIHPIPPDSPLHGDTPESLVEEEAMLLVSVTGLEEATGQTVHARHGYAASDMLWNRRHHDIFAVDATGERFLDYRLFDETVPVADTTPA